MRELMKLCGIRVIAAFHIVAAVGDVKRFSNSQKTGRVSRRCAMHTSKRMPGIFCRHAE